MNLIPQPKVAEKRDGKFTIRYGSFVVLEESCGPLLTKQAQLFLEGLEGELGYRPALTRGEGRDGDMILRVENALGQGYILEVYPEKIILTGGEKGLWHGMQTILQMVK